MTHVLALDIAGNCYKWLEPEKAAAYVAAGKVAWSIGDPAFVMRGGVRCDGRRSALEISPVIAIANSGLMAANLRDDLQLGDRNELLFRRDRHLCGYCGEQFPDRDLTRDHVQPVSRGGLDVWENCVTACGPCNWAKGARRPEEWGRKLLFVPYQPTRNEHFLLQRRNILADQMDYLCARLPKHSRVPWQN